MGILASTVVATLFARLVVRDRYTVTAVAGDPRSCTQPKAMPSWSMPSIAPTMLPAAHEGLAIKTVTSTNRQALRMTPRTIALDMCQDSIASLPPTCVASLVSVLADDVHRQRRAFHQDGCDNYIFRCGHHTGDRRDRAS